MAFIFLISVHCISPQFCYGDAITKQPNESAKNIIPATGTPLSPDDPDWQTAGGFSLYAAPEKPRFSFGEDIVFILTLKNESQIDLKCSGLSPSDLYHFTILDSNGVEVPEEFFVPGGSRLADFILHPNECKEQKSSIDRLFVFTSAGVYTVRAWQNVRSLDGGGIAKLYSNKFTFELYGNPRNPKNRITNVIRTQLPQVDRVKRLMTQPLQAINTKYKYTLPGSYTSREWRSVGFVGERINTNDFAFKLRWNPTTRMYNTFRSSPREIMANDFEYTYGYTSKLH
jgi:hypothetical protein